MRNQRQQRKADGSRRGPNDALVAPGRLRSESFRLLIDQVQDYAIYMLDPEGRVATWNAGARRIKGYSATQILGQHFSIFFTEADRAAGVPERELKRAAEVGEVEEEGWRVRKDGTRFWANVVVTAVHDDDGVLIGFGKVTRDLTAQREEQERLRFLIESVRDYAIFMMDPEGRIQSWNPGAERLKGYSAEEIIGQSFERFYPPDERAAHTPQWMLEQARIHGRVEAEGWRLRKDGTRFWALVVITAVHDGDGSLRGFAKVTRDVTERRRLTFLGDASAILGASLDISTTLEKVAQLSVPFFADWCAVHLLEQGQLKTVTIAHSDPAKVQRGLEVDRRFPPHPETSATSRVARNGRSELFPEITDALLEQAISDPERRTEIRSLGFRSVMVVPLTHEGRRLGAMTFAHSETSQRYGPEDVQLAEDLARRCAVAIENARAHAALRVEREFLETVVQQMPQGVIIFEADGNPLIANPQALRILGVGAVGEVHKADHLSRFYRPNGEPCPTEQWPSSRALRNGEVVLDEEIEFFRGGERVALSVGAAPVRDPEGRVVGAVATFQDVSERRRAVERAEQEAHFRERFVGILGHDLRNPLSAIVASAHLLLRKGLPEPHAKAVGRIASSADRMARMISDLLDLTRARLAGGIPVAPQRVELSELGHKVVEELEIAHPECELVFHAQGETHAEVDPERISQVLSNLVSNAIQYGCGEPVRVRIDDRGETVELEVHNRGEPIPEELLPLLFDPFRRGNRTTSERAAQGLGLGLFIAHEIVSAHGGTIDVRSTREEGTTFRVRLLREFPAGLARVVV